MGAPMKSIPGQLSEEFASTLIDAAKAREIRKNYEAELAKAKDDPKKIGELKEKEKYDDALIGQKGMTIFNNSTVVVLEAAVSNLAKTKEGNLALKIVTTLNEQSNVQMDDYLNATFKTNLQIALKNTDQAFTNLPESVSLASEETKKVELTKGSADGSLLVLMPQNKASVSDLVMDAQAQVVKPLYRP